jgi:hypothetical protein
MEITPHFGNIGRTTIFSPFFAGYDGQRGTATHLLDTDFAQLLGGVLGWLGFQFARSRNPHAAQDEQKRCC